jgi:hypothetical protein
MATTGRIVVAPGQTIDAVGWGQPVWDQSVQCFDSPADRDNQYAAPHDGALCFTADTGSLWIRRAGAWVLQPAPGVGRGTLAQAISAANSTATTTNVNWFSAPPFTVDGTRRVRVSFTGLLNANTAGDVGSLRVLDGATALQEARQKMTVVGGQGQLTATGVWQGVPGAGTKTYTLNVGLVAGTGPVTGIHSASAPATLLIEDIGI